ncbi:MAG: hypothetical protein HRT35_13935 [Algicola sp.]|nr:hypothetical protein [Algicola sp.]
MLQLSQVVKTTIRLALALCLVLAQAGYCSVGDKPSPKAFSYVVDNIRWQLDIKPHGVYRINTTAHSILLSVQRIEAAKVCLRIHNSPQIEKIDDIFNQPAMAKTLCLSAQQSDELRIFGIEKIGLVFHDNKRILYP